MGGRGVSQTSERYEEFLFEVFASLPRQGPGRRDCAARALQLCRELPTNPAILDLGCGVGGQTLQLAELTTGTIVAVDNHAPNISRLRDTVAAKGLADRITPVLADMTACGQAPASFDLVWSEGALYCIGLANALDLCRDLLRPGGYLAFTEAVWRKDNPPAEVRAMFDVEYPAMDRLAGVLQTTRDSGLTVVGHFTLPERAWWDDFYTPMLERIAALRTEYDGDAEAAEILDQLAAEPALHRDHGQYYAYEFIVARKPRAPGMEVFR